MRTYNYLTGQVEDDSQGGLSSKPVFRQKLDPVKEYKVKCVHAVTSVTFVTQAHIPMDAISKVIAKHGKLAQGAEYYVFHNGVQVLHQPAPRGIVKGATADKIPHHPNDIGESVAIERMKNGGIRMPHSQALKEFATKFDKALATTNTIQAPPVERRKVVRAPVPLEDGARLPWYSQWKAFIEARTMKRFSIARDKEGKLTRQATNYAAAAMLPTANDKENIKVLCIACGTPVDYSTAITRIVRGARDAKVREDVPTVTVGCIVKLTEKDVIELFGQLIEVERKKVMPVSAKGYGCPDCQLLFARVVAATKIANDAAERVWQNQCTDAVRREGYKVSGKLVVNSLGQVICRPTEHAGMGSAPNKRQPWIEVDPRVIRRDNESVADYMEATK
jgi:hypothetical protein